VLGACAFCGRPTPLAPLRVFTETVLRHGPESLLSAFTVLRWRSLGARVGG
jgi:hypothetical protein